MMKRIAVYLIITVLLFPGSFEAVGQEVLAWQDCIKEAARNHPDLIVADESVKQSQSSKAIAASGLLPQINVGLDASTTHAKDASGSRTSESYSYGVTGSQLIFDGSKTRENLKVASQNIKAAQFSYRFTSTEVRLRLRGAFIDLLKAQEQLMLTQEIFSIRRSNLELIALRYESGIEHRGALFTAQANMAESEFQITQNKRALEVAQSELTKEMGRKTFLPLRVEGDLKVKEASSEKPDFDELAQRNPSLGRAIAQKNAAFFAIRAEEADFFPELSVSAAANKENTHWPPRDSQLSAGISVSLPLFEGGRRSAEVAKARSEYRAAQANERSTKDSIIVSLQQSWAALQDAIDSVDVQKKFLDAAVERSKIAESQYSLGLIQFDNWTIIEDDLVSAKRAFLNAQVNALLAQANWIQAKGETLEYAD